MLLLGAFFCALVIIWFKEKHHKHGVHYAGDHNFVAVARRPKYNFTAQLQATRSSTPNKLVVELYKQFFPGALQGAQLPKQ